MKHNLRKTEELRRHLPVREGDQRWVMIEVLKPSKEVVKSTLYARLLKEAPYFLCTLLDMKLPPGQDRLYLPPIMTQLKRDALALQNQQLTEQEYQFMRSIVQLADQGFFDGPKTATVVAEKMYENSGNASLVSRNFKKVRRRLEFQGFRCEQQQNSNESKPATIYLTRAPKPLNSLDASD